MAITPVRCRGEAREISGWDGRQHTLDLNGRHVMTFVDHDVAVAADEIAKVAAAGKCLDHRDIDSSRQAATPSTEPPNRLRCDVEELAEPFDPLFYEWLAVHEDKRGARATGNQLCCNHSLAPAWGCAQDTDVMLKKRAGSGFLRAVELTAKFQLDRLAVDTFVAQDERDVELLSQGDDIG